MSKETRKRVVRGTVAWQPVAAEADNARRGIHSRLIGGVAWIAAVSLLSQGSVFLCTLISARLLGHDDFGRVAAIQSIVVTFATFAGLGLGTTAIKYISELRDRSPDRVGRILGLCQVATLVTSAVYSLGLVCFAPWIAQSWLHAPALTSALRWSAIYAFFFTVNGYQVGAMAGFEAFSRLAKVNAIVGPLSLALTFLLAYFHGLRGAILALGATAACSWLLHQAALRSECRRHAVAIRYAKLHREIPLMWNFTLPAALAGCISGAALTACNLLLACHKGTFGEVAIFNAAYTIRMLALLAPNMVSRVSMPLLCNLRAGNHRHAYRQTFYTCLLLNGGLTATAAMLLYFMAPNLLALFGKDFAGGRMVIGLLLAAASAEAVAVVLFQQLYGHGKLWTHLAIMVCWSSVLVGGTWWTVDRAGAAAMAGAYLAAWLTAGTLYGIVARQLFSSDQAPVPNFGSARAIPTLGEPRQPMPEVAQA